MRTDYPDTPWGHLQRLKDKQATEPKPESGGGEDAAVEAAVETAQLTKKKAKKKKAS